MNRPKLYYSVLMWPVVSLIVTGVIHFSLEAGFPDLHDVFIPAVLAPALLGYGVWIGYRMVRGGGTYLDALVGGLIAGLLPLALEIVGFGVLLGRGVQPGLIAGLFGFSQVAFGSLIGGGFAISAPQRASD